jgi:DNA-binding LytR/AlgR family response regulator
LYYVALCDDEKIYSDAQARICRKILDSLNIEYQISVFDGSVNFLTSFAKEQKRYDLILLDIVMDGANGIELAKTIRESDKDAVIIFITASREYTLQGYDVNALHYLMKPVDATILERLIKSAYNDKFQSNYFIFKSGVQNIRISTKDIISLETTGRKVEITLQNETLQYSGKLTELLAELPNDRFVRCHQAFAVNINNIRELTRQDAIAVNGKKIPISRAFLKDVQKAFLRQMQDL